MIFELEDGVLNQVTETNMKQIVPLTSIYTQKINDKFSLLINSFKNKVFVVDNHCIKKDYLEIDPD